MLRVPAENICARTLCVAMVFDRTWASCCAMSIDCRYQDNPRAISARRRPDGEQYLSAFNLSCFIADMFALRLVDALTMHECLGILLREMVGVEHVFAIQAMVMRAGAGLWQGADSHRLLREFTSSFLERSSWLRDDASLSGLRASIQEVVKVCIMPLNGYSIRPCTHCSLRRMAILFARSTNGMHSIPTTHCLRRHLFGRD